MFYDITPNNWRFYVIISLISPIKLFQELMHEIAYFSNPHDDHRFPFNFDTAVANFEVSTFMRCFGIDKSY